MTGGEGSFMHRRLSVTVFCGSSFGADPAIRDAAAALGDGLARAGIRMVYGGARVGLMGIVADAALAAGGEVLGVLPAFLRTAEIAHPALTRLEIADSMHARKQRMFALSDAFVSFAGGIGTLEETVEVLSLRQLGLHTKPILICDVAGTSAALQAVIEDTIARGFARPSFRDCYDIVNGVAALLARLAGLAPGSMEPMERL